MNKSILAGILALVAAVPPALAQAVPATQAAFVSGGVGDDSAARMAAVDREYNLKLLFAARDGHYLADVAVMIKTEAGGNVLATISEGPFLFVKLPAGKYQVTADYAGNAQTRSTTIAASGRRELVFRWEEAPE